MSYLALGDGPPSFPPDSSCPVVLRIPLAVFRFRLQDCHFLRCDFPITSPTLRQCYPRSLPRHNKLCRFGLFPFRSPLLGESLFYFLFLRVLRCFSSPGSPPYAILFTYEYHRITNGVFPHSDIYGSTLICNSP